MRFAQAFAGATLEEDNGDRGSGPYVVYEIESANSLAAMRMPNILLYGPCRSGVKKGVVAVAAIPAFANRGHILGECMSLKRPQ